MDSEESEESTEGEISNMVPNDRTLFQSVRIRYNTILANISDRHFVESQSRYVWYSGAILWLIHFTAMAI